MPAKVPQLTVLDYSSRAANLSWIAPSDNQSPITRYTILYKVKILPKRKSLFFILIFISALQYSYLAGCWKRTSLWKCYSSHAQWSSTQYYLYHKNKEKLIDSLYQQKSFLIDNCSDNYLSINQLNSH